MSRTSLLKTFSLAGAGVAMLCAVSACSDGTPTEAQAREVFAKEVEGYRGGTARIASFKKTNGVQSEAFGFEVYQLHFDAVVEYPEGINPDCVDLLKTDDEELKNSGNKFDERLSRKRYCGMSITTVLPPGGTQDVQKSIAFVKTENGWIPEKELR